MCDNDQTKDVTVTFNGVDYQKPTVTLTSNVVQCKKWWTTYTITGTYSEWVSGVETWDLTLTNASVVSFKSVSSTVYVWTVKANTTSYGTAKAKIAADTATDSIGNGNTESNEISWTYDNLGPIFMFSDWAVNECTAWSLSITSVSQVWCATAHTSPYSFDNSIWNSTTTWTFSTGGTQPWSGNKIAYVRDSLGNVTSHTATWNVIDVAPTASDFTLSDNVWKTARTGDWKTLSSAAEWECGNGSLIATVKTNGSKWSCSISGNVITYTPASWKVWEDTCVITIMDNENSMKDVTVTVDSIDTVGPTCGTWTYTPALNVCTSWSVTATLSNSTDDESWIAMIS